MATGEAKIRVREEGNWVNAYIELVAGAESIHFAALRKTVLEMHPELFEEFNGFLVKIVAAIVEQLGAEIIGVQTEPAPEHERAGHG
jgi:hypothetical protein